MNQRSTGARSYLARLTGDDEDRRTASFPAEAAEGLERGARILFFEMRGDGDSAKGYLTGWGEIERLAAEEGRVTVRLRDYVAFKRRVPFADLRADPRRDRDAELQPVTIEVFNTVLSKARR